MPRKRKDRPSKTPRNRPQSNQPAELRIIGGTLGGRKLASTGHARTRPMKDRLRETLFNLLGSTVQGKHAIDLFAGSGALALEAISRGAARATLVERHLATAELVRTNAAELGVVDRVEVVWGDAFRWAQTQTPSGNEPWLVFCSPPYAFYAERQQEMGDLVRGLLERAPPASMFVVESDEHFDTQSLPDPARWEVRHYPPAVIGIYEKQTPGVRPEAGD